MDALQLYLDSVRHTPFQWGEHDCALCAAKWVDGRFGTALADLVRSFGVRSARDYRRLQRAGKSLEGLTEEALGQPIDAKPEREDIVLVRTTRGASLGIAAPPIILCAGANGIEALPLSSAARVWRPSCRR